MVVQWSALLPQSKRVPSLFACSPCVYVAFLQVSQLPPRVRIQVRIIGDSKCNQLQLHSQTSV